MVEFSYIKLIVEGNNQSRLLSAHLHVLEEQDDHQQPQGLPCAEEIPSFPNQEVRPLDFREINGLCVYQTIA